MVDQNGSKVALSGLGLTPQSADVLELSEWQPKIDLAALVGILRIAGVQTGGGTV